MRRGGFELLMHGLEASRSYVAITIRNVVEDVFALGWDRIQYDTLFSVVLSFVNFVGLD